ncbi:helix-turn-helix transcriptional regulator [Herpetosiphon llansteffanensis]|uniref:helix-turn-helix transcriptional regulator n=1 Tax=Herpetosiphon llansteffanensis TaxID=2094568 RepID=UPI000D7BF2C2|nr:WYL domain-containing protein [Herpetosiphon llansteffanensis]
MPKKNHDYTKIMGVRQLERFLLERRTPIRQSELATIFNCNRSTIRLWLVELELDDVPIRRTKDRRVYIDRASYLMYVRLSRDESLITMIALRLMQQHLQQSNLHGLEVMHKLGMTLSRGVASLAGEHILQQTAHQRTSLPSLKSKAQRALEKIGEAWLSGRKISWRYQPLRGVKAFNEVFHPYMIEPIALGGSTYVVGFSEQAQSLRARKIERIISVPVIEDEHFDVHSTFDPIQLFEGAWGIWFSQDEQPITISVRFQRHVRQRVLETRWHPSQTIHEDASGNLIWQAVLDDWTPIVPWIRGWGADCEVLEPSELRHAIIANLERSQSLYGLSNNPQSTTPNDDVLRTLLGE